MGGGWRTDSTIASSPCFGNDDGVHQPGYTAVLCSMSVMLKVLNINAHQDGQPGSRMQCMAKQKKKSGGGGGGDDASTASDSSTSSWPHPAVGVHFAERSWALPSAADDDCWKIYWPGEGNGRQPGLDWENPV